MMEKEDGRKLPRPCSFNCNRKTWCSSLSNSRCYLSTAQDLPQHTARSCSSSPSYTHMALQTTSGTSIPFVWEYGGQSVPGMHGTIGALSLNLQNSLSFGRVRSLLCNPNGRVSQIQMMKEPRNPRPWCKCADEHHAIWLQKHLWVWPGFHIHGGDREDVATVV